MPAAYYFTHTQLRVDPSIPVRDWHLSDEGRARVLRVAGAPWLQRVTRVITSTEYRVIETAHILAGRRHLPVEIHPQLRDHARPPSEFLSVIELDRSLDAFFARPAESAKPGWETAADAQRRVVTAMDALLRAKTDDGDLVIIGHGGVGTLLLCHLVGVPIARQHYPPPPGGTLFAFDCASRRVLFRWRPVAPPL